MKTTSSPALTNLQAILARLPGLLLPSHVLVQQQLQFSNLINAALSHNYDFADVRNRPVTSKFLMPTLEKVLIERAGGLPTNLHSLLFNAPKSLFKYREAEGIRFRHPEPADQTVRQVTTDGNNNSRQDKSFVPKLTATTHSVVQPKEEYTSDIGSAHKPFQNVSMLLYTALADSMRKQEMGQAVVREFTPTTLHRNIPKVVITNTSKQPGQGHHFFRVLEDVVKASTLLSSSNERVFNLVPTIYNSTRSIKFMDRMMSPLRRSPSPSKDVPVSLSAEGLAPRLSKNPATEYSRGHVVGSELGLSKTGIVRRKESKLKAPPRDAARRKVALKGAERPAKLAQLQQSGPVPSTTAVAALLDVVRLQNSIGKVVANIASNTSKKVVVKQSVSGSPTAIQRKALGASRKYDALFSLAHYLASSKDLIDLSHSTPAISELGEKADKQRGVIKAKTEAETPESLIKKFSPMLPVSELLSTIVTSLSAIATPNSQSGSGVRLFSPNLHSILLKKLIDPRHVASMRETDVPLSANSENIYPRQHTDANNNDNTLKQTGDDASRRFNSHIPIYTKDDLMDSGLFLPLFAKASVKDVKTVILAGLQSMYGLQNLSGKVKGGPVQAIMIEGSESVTPATEIPRYMMTFEPLLRERSLTTPSLEGLKKERPHAKSSNRNAPVGVNSAAERSIETDDKYVASRLVGLQQVYSGYTLSSVMHKTRNTSISGLMTANSISPIPRSHPQKGVSNMERSSLVAPRHKKLQDGSIDLPRISQLQTMLSRAYHSIHKPDSAAAYPGLLLSNNQVVSTPVNRLSAPQRSVESFNSWVATKSNPSGPIREDSSKSRDMHESRFRIGKSSNSLHKDGTAYKDLTLRNLRKMIEQIFQEELKRYGL